MQSLKEFAKHWYIYDKCPYIQSKLKRGGKYSRSFAEIRRSQLRRYILPTFGKLLLSQITPNLIENWLFNLKDIGLSNSSVNHIYSTLKLIMKEAYRLGEIDDNPTNRVLPFIPKPKKKGVLTQKEVDLLFGPNSLKEIWSNNSLHYLLNLTASKTGMRIGELQCLKKDFVYSNYIKIAHSWNRKYGEKETKTGVIRYAPISKDHSKRLLEFSKEYSHGNYIFSVNKGNSPIDHKAITKHFYRALESINISEKERRTRNITFHSWRHYVNSKFRLKGVPDQVIRKIIGHQDTKMTDHYTNFNPEDLVKILSKIDED